MFAVTWLGRAGEPVTKLVTDYRTDESGVLNYEQIDGRTGCMAPGTWMQVSEVMDRQVEMLRVNHRLDFESEKSLRVGEETPT